MAFGGSGSNDIEIRVRVDESGTLSFFDSLGNELQEVEGASNRASDGFTRVGAQLVTLNSAVQLAQTGIGLIVRGFRELGDVVETGGRIDSLTRSFENLQTSAGAVADDTLAGLRSATRGLVSDLDLITQANTAFVLGLPNEKLDELADAAVKLGQAFGRTANEALGDLVNGLGRGSAEVLNNLGIIIRAEDAYTQYAARLGKAKDDLTALEQVQAIQTIGLEQAIKKASELSGVQENASTAYTRLSASIENVKNQTLQEISQNDNLRQAFEELIGVIEDIDFKRLGQDLSEVIGIFADATAGAIPGIIDALHEIPAEIEKVKLGFLTLKNLSAKDILFDINNAVANAGQRALGDLNAIKFADALKKAGDAASDFTPTLDEMFESSEITQRGLDRMKRRLDDIAHSSGLTAEQQKTLNEHLKDGYRWVEQHQKALDAETEAAKKNTKATADVVKPTADAAKAKKELAEAERASELAFKTNTTAIQNQLTAVQKLVDQSPAVKAAMEAVRGGQLTPEQGGNVIALVTQSAVTSQTNYNIALEEYNQLLGASSANVLTNNAALFEARLRYDEATASQETFGRSTESTTAKIGEQTTALGQMLGSFQSNSFGQLASSFGFGDTTSAWIGLIGQAVGEGAAAFNEDSEGMNRTKEAARRAGRVVGDAFSFGISVAFRQIVGEENARAIEDFSLAFRLIDHAFGEDEATTGRKAVDKWFSQLFDENNLAVIVGGKLERITDLVFRGDSLFAGKVDFGEQFFQSLESLPENVAGIFSDIGQTFGDLLGVSEEVSALIGAAFVNNVGGDLNNLQQVIEATGVSFQQLGDTAIDAFFEGEISIVALQQRLESLREVMTPGIPGAIGDVGRAFENMNAAGVNGGRELLDSLRDIGLEARERGITSFEQLRSTLINTFKQPPQQVDALIQSIRNAGLTFQQFVELSQEGWRGLIASAANYGSFIENGVVGTSQNVEDPTAPPVATGGGGGGGGGGGAPSGPSEAELAAKRAEEAIESLRDQIANLKRESKLDELKDSLDQAIEGNNRAAFDELLENFRKTTKEGVLEGLEDTIKDAGAKGKRLGNQIANAETQKELDAFNEKFAESVKRLAEANEQQRQRVTDRLGDQLSRNVDRFTTSVDKIDSSNSEVANQLARIQERFRADFQASIERQLSGFESLSERDRAARERIEEEVRAGIEKTTTAQIAAIQENTKALEAAAKAFESSVESQGKGIFSILEKNPNFSSLSGAGLQEAAEEAAGIYRAQQAASLDLQEALRTFLLTGLTADLDVAIERYNTANERLDIFTGKVDENGNAVDRVLTPLERLQQSLIGVLGAVNPAALQTTFGAFTLNLNDLQVAALGVGVTFDQLKQKAIDDFLNGSTDAITAANAMIDAGQGIAGVTGGVLQAYQNFQSFGTQGGRFTVDALRDIAAEAKELGASTLDGIERVLLAGGVPLEEIQKLIISLQDAGIDELNELLTIDDSSAINVISALSSANFPFKETTQDVRDLLKEIQSLPTSKDVTINLKVQAPKDPVMVPVMTVDGSGRPIAAGGFTFRYYGDGDDSPGITS